MDVKLWSEKIKLGPYINPAPQTKRIPYFEYYERLDNIVVGTLDDKPTYEIVIDFIFGWSSEIRI